MDGKMFEEKLFILTIRTMLLQIFFKSLSSRLAVDIAKNPEYRCWGRMSLIYEEFGSKIINPFLCTGIREKYSQSLKFTGKCIRIFFYFGS
jgi:hypothetical protein